MQDQAQKVLEHGAYWYIAGAAGTGKTDVANKDAFDDWRIVSRARNRGAQTWKLISRHIYRFLELS